MSQDKAVTRGLGRRGAGLAAAVVLGALSAMLAGSAGSGTAHASDEANAACGAPGQPSCPMQEWMRRRVSAPLASSDMTALAKALDESAAMSPDPSWAEWAPIARAGAEAARRDDTRGARASCTGCHRLYKKPYREKFRARPIPQ